MTAPDDLSAMFDPSAREARLNAELERYSALFAGCVPIFATHTVALSKLALRDPESGETRVRDVLEFWRHQPTGPSLTYLLPDDARALAAILVDYARQADSGIIGVSAGHGPLLVPGKK